MSPYFPRISWNLVIVFISCYLYAVLPVPISFPWKQKEQSARQCKTIKKEKNYYKLSSPFIICRFLHDYNRRSSQLKINAHTNWMSLITNTICLRENIEDPWRPTGKNKKELKAKKVHSISTSENVNESGILAWLMSLMMSDLNSTRKDKFTNFTNTEATVGWWRWFSHRHSLETRKAKY